MKLSRREKELLITACGWYISRLNNVVSDEFNDMSDLIIEVMELDKRLKKELN